MSNFDPLKAANDILCMNPTECRDLATELIQEEVEQVEQVEV